MRPTNDTRRRYKTKRDKDVGQGGKLYTITEVQHRLSIGRTKVYELCAREIPTVRIGRSLRVKKEDLDLFIAQHRR